MTATAFRPQDEANAEVLRRMLEAFNEGDDDSFVELVHPEVEFVTLVVPAVLTSAPYSGPTGVRRYLRDVRAAWDEVSVEMERVREAGRTIVALGTIRGRAGGGPLEATTTWVSTLRDGLVAHGLVVSDEPEVGRALGVRVDALPALAPPLRLELAATPESVPRARESLMDWAANLAPSSEELHALQAAVTEGVTNAILHAHPGAGWGRVLLRAEAGYGGVVVVIEDDGQGMRPRPDSPGLGMGLSLMGQLADSVTIGRAAEREGGCRLEMTFGIGSLKGLVTRSSRQRVA